MEIKQSILYVDDERDNLSAFRAVFRRHYQVHCAQSGEEAIALLGQQNIDLVISDQRMPGMTGVELFERIQASHPDLSRIILTGYSDMQAIVDAINKGKVYHYVTKPWRMEEVRLIMEKALETQALRQQNQRLLEEKHRLELRAAQQERAGILSRFEALKAQLNPHFLFNSMNVLSSLIASDQERAVEFVAQFCRVYRNLLEQGGEALVSLRQEWELVQGFLFLQKMRFEEALQVEWLVPESCLNASLPPFALQLLVENAIKHNVVSTEAPLHIRILEEGGFLCVQNPLQQRGDSPVSTKIGLSNLAERYALLMPQMPSFGEEAGNFVARVPLVFEA